MDNLQPPRRAPVVMGVERAGLTASTAPLGDEVLVTDGESWASPSAASALSEGALRHRLVRVSSHGLIWLVILVPTLLQLNRGWLPLGDDAEATARSLEVLSLRPPLVGMLSGAFPTASHQPSNLGPLLFWLLAIPVHLSVATGALWGAALLDALVLSLAFEAAFRNRLWMGAGLTVAFAVVFAWRLPGVFFDPAWNAYFGLVFLAASMVFAYVVIMSRRRWWPVLVFTGSVAAQCHLAFVLPAVLLIVGAPVYSMLAKDRPRIDGAARRAWWFWSGLLVAGFCWLPTLLQEISGHPGNLSAVLHDKSTQHSLGIPFGLRSFATAVSPIPLWLRHPLGLPPFTHPPIIPIFPAAGSAEEVLTSHSVFVGVFGLCFLVAVTVAGRARRRPALSGLSYLTLLSALGAVASYSSFPSGVTAAGPLTYLIPLLWVISVLWWFVVGWVAWWAATWAVSRHTILRGFHAREGPTFRRCSLVGFALLLVILSVMALSGVSHSPLLPPVVLDQNAEVHSYLSSVRLNGPGQLVVPSKEDLNVDEPAISLYLRTIGKTVDLSPTNGERTAGLDTPASAHWPTFAVIPDPAAVFSCIGRSRDCTNQLSFSYARGCGQRDARQSSDEDRGYVLYGGGHIVGFGMDAEVPYLIADRTGSSVVSLTATPNAWGYWEVSADGSLTASGDARSYGSVVAKTHRRPVKGMICTPTDGGYWLYDDHGDVFAFGDAGLYGSGSPGRSSPVVGMAATKDGKGYWLASADGSVLSFGDAPGLGSLAPAGASVVAISSTSEGKGYWLVTNSGGTYPFGDARSYGDMAGRPLNRPMVGIVPTGDDRGYWLIAADGGVFAFGDARFEGSLGAYRISGIVGAIS